MPKTANPRLGRYVSTAVAGEKVRAFVPPPLPPVPQLDLLSLLGPLSEADRAVGRLDGITALVPDTSLFLYMYVRKEAVLSSQIEGTQSSIADLLLGAPFQGEQDRRGRGVRWALNRLVGHWAGFRRF